MRDEARLAVDHARAVRAQRPRNGRADILGARHGFALLHECLILEAQRELAYTPADIVAIADGLGFDDPAYFSRLFAKRTGQSPSAYRKAIAAGLAALPERVGA